MNHKSRVTPARSYFDKLSMNVVRSSIVKLNSDLR